jgi:GNAT superfamily N-acetyltransferase
MNRPQLVTAAALNLAERHDAPLRAQGLRTADDGGLWRCYDDNDAPFLAAITTEFDLDPAAATAVARDLAAQRQGTVFICDSFNNLELADAGLHLHPDAPTYMRPPGPPVDEPDPEGLEIRIATREADLPAWDAIERAAFGGAPLRTQLAPPALLDDPRFYFFVARLDGEAVACATALLENGITGVYDVGTLPSARGRGIASALMRRTLGIAPYAPTVLQPSTMAEAMYRRLGFAEIARFRRWATVTPEEWGP